MCGVRVIGVNFGVAAPLGEKGEKPFFPQVELGFNLREGHFEEASPFPGDKRLYVSQNK